MQWHGKPVDGPTSCGERPTNKAIVLVTHMMILGAGNVLAILGTPDGVADMLCQLGQVNAQGAADVASLTAGFLVAERVG